MCTTAINNYMDYKKAIKKSGYGYESHNAIVKDKLKESTVVATILILLVIASVTGVFLVLNTNIIVFFIGGLSFLVGILYSFGPVPISRMPLGEVFSGLFMGFVIILVSTLIHTGNAELLWLEYAGGLVSIRFDLWELVYLFLISAPAILCIANIMLANNICDIEDDLENRRYTLPIYIGKPAALVLFRVLYYLSFIDLIVLCLLGVNPLLLIIGLVAYIPVFKNIKAFMNLQSKQHTFALAVKNFIILNAGRIVVIGAAAALKLM
ncbi:1,4-dihydroxy-2-naphthoate octaprenyltransferase [compost metagenome]